MRHQKARPGPRRAGAPPPVMVPVSLLPEPDRPSASRALAAAPSRRARPAEIATLQRSAGNAAVCGLLGRQRGSGAPAPASTPALQRQPAAPALAFTGVTIPLPEASVDFGKASYVRGSIGSEGEIALQPMTGAPVGVGYANQGAKLDVELARQEAVRLGNSLTLDEVTEGLSFELSRKQVNVSLGVQATLKTALPFVSGTLAGQLIMAKVEWDKPDSATAFGLEASGGLAGEGPIRLGGLEVMAKPKVVLTGTLSPNWPRILAQAGRHAAQGASQGAVKAVSTKAGTAVLAVDTAALTSAAAAIAVPLAAAVAMGYGVFQGIRNTRAAVAAANRGVTLRQSAREYAEGYARSLTGGKGSGPGAAEAERQLDALAAASGATRDIAVAAVRYQQGSYAQVYQRALARVRDVYYVEACAQFDESHEPHFGWLERLGESWGMRGVFRTNLRIVLYSDQ